jgi:hypothetical protein
MRGQVFRLKTPTLGMIPSQRLPVPIPQDAVVIVQDEPCEETVNVSWEGRALMMFVKDLTERAELVPGPYKGALQ